MAHGLTGRSGWVLLSYVPRTGRLINQVGTEHGHGIAGAVPVLALDMYEHAYHLEFGANATAYVAAFMRNIDWTAVQVRHEDALQVPRARLVVQPSFADLPSISPEDVRTLLESGARVHLVDVRPRHYSTRAGEMMDGAVWRDPERVDHTAWKAIKGRVKLFEPG